MLVNKEEKPDQKPAAEFFKKRAGKAQGDGLYRILRRVPKNKPDPGDELP
jgi:hypothetical protein